MTKIKTIEELFLLENNITELFADQPISRLKPKIAKINAIKKVEHKSLPQVVHDDQILESPDKLMKLTRELADKAKTLEQLKEIVMNFDKLSICKTAINTVFSDGKADAKIIAIGEAPGASEDEQGIPFCGASGFLLDKMFSSVGLSRLHNIYITNTVFWRPPGNRRPTPEETMVCLPFVEKHIALINPDLLLLVGATACSSILANCDSISKIKSKKHTYTNRYLAKEIPVEIIFHPAYLLRQPKMKKDTWFDLLKIKSLYSSSFD